MTRAVGVIGGTGLEEILASGEEAIFNWRGLSIRFFKGLVGDTQVFFIPRHGPKHEYPPHRVPYKGYMTLFRCMGVDRVIGLSAVGSLRLDLEPGAIVIPTNLIDYSLHGSTFYDERVVHVDFTYPYCQELVEVLYTGLFKAGLDVRFGYTYVATYGPRFESAAEIEFLRRAGADVVGMTSIPESVLAREAGIHYALVAVVSNYAAGLQRRVTEDEVYMVMKRVLDGLKTGLRQIIPHVSEIDLKDGCSSSSTVFLEVVGSDCKG